MSNGEARRERLFIAQIVISLVVLLGALYVIFLSAAPNAAKWAIGIAGLVVGFWLRDALTIGLLIIGLVIFLIIFLIFF